MSEYLLLLTAHNLEFSTVECIYMASNQTRLQTLEIKTHLWITIIWIVTHKQTTQQYQLLLVHLPPVCQKEATAQATGRDESKLHCLFQIAHTSTCTDKQVLYTSTLSEITHLLVLSVFQY